MATRVAPQQKNGRALRSFLPILEWLPQYNRAWLRPDVIAALTLWAVLVPEAMAYAAIAGMPAETGLYAAPLALIAYAVFGTSRHLHIGPSSAVAALSFSVVVGLTAAGSPAFIVLTIALALVTGILLILGGLLRLGVLADFLSRPVLDGFVVGVAITIAVGQLDKLLGFQAEGVYDLTPQIVTIARHIGMTHWPTLVVGLLSLALLFGMHKYTPKIPAAIVLLFLAIAASSLLGFERMGIHVVGEIPAGLPNFGLPADFGLDDLLAVAPGAIGVALVAFAESVAISRALATKHGYEVDANQEMAAIGLANLGSGFSGAFAVNGSMSRTSVAENAGAKSQMVSIIAAVAILITAAFLTPLFYALPEAVLGAIVIHAVWHNITLREVNAYRKITRVDYATALVAMGGVLAFGLLEGLLLAAVVGLLSLLAGTKKRNTTALGKVPGSNTFRSVENYPHAETYPGLLIIRFDGTLFYANVPDFQSAVRQMIADADPPPKIILIDCESINDVDATAVLTLRDFHKQLQAAQIELRFARVKTNVMAIMERGGLLRAVPPDHFYPSVEAGVDAALAER